MIVTERKTDKASQGWLAANDSEPNDTTHFHWRVMGSPMAWRPPTDVYITDETVIVRIEIAGMHDGEFVISYENHTLSIRGSRPDHAERRAYHQMEIRFGEFRTDIELHWPINADKIEAEYHDGFLRLVLPKAEPYNVEIQD